MIGIRESSGDLVGSTYRGRCIFEPRWRLTAGLSLGPSRQKLMPNCSRLTSLDPWGPGVEFQFSSRLAAGFCQTLKQEMASNTSAHGARRCPAGAAAMCSAVVLPTDRGNHVRESGRILLSSIPGCQSLAADLTIGVCGMSQWAAGGQGQCPSDAKANAIRIHFQLLLGSLRGLCLSKPMWIVELPTETIGPTMQPLSSREDRRDSITNEHEEIWLAVRVPGARFACPSALHVHKHGPCMQIDERTDIAGHLPPASWSFDPLATATVWVCVCVWSLWCLSRFTCCYDFGSKAPSGPVLERRRPRRLVPAFFSHYSVWTTPVQHFFDVLSRIYFHPPASPVVAVFVDLRPALGLV